MRLIALPPDAFDAQPASVAVPLEPHRVDAMTAHPLSANVDRRANDVPRCVAPL